MTWLITYSAVVAGIITMNLARAFLVPMLLRNRPYRERDRRNPDP